MQIGPVLVVLLLAAALDADQHGSALDIGCGAGGGRRETAMNLGVWPTGWLHGFDTVGNYGDHRIEAATVRDYSQGSAHEVHRNQVYGNCGWHSLR